MKERDVVLMTIAQADGLQTAEEVLQVALNLLEQERQS
jgi:hypothetical protein